MAQRSPAKKSIRQPTRVGTRSSVRIQDIEPPCPCPTPTMQPVSAKRRRSPQQSETEGDKLKGVRPSAKQEPPLQPSRLTIPPLSSIKQKHRIDSEAETEPDELEDVRSSQQNPGLAPSILKRLEAECHERQVFPYNNQLSERNLQILENNMDPAANVGPTLKRTLSGRSTIQSETETERTQRSFVSTATYRRENLAAAEIHIHAEPPDYIQAAIDRIINANVSQKRRSELRVVAKELRDGCMKQARAQAGEVNFLNSLHNAIVALDLKHLCINRNTNWREELKPVASPQSLFSWSLISGAQQLEAEDVLQLGVDDFSAPPQKRQRAAVPYRSPGSSTINARIPPNDIQYPVLTAGPWETSIKTPRPDILMGIELTALISALSLQNLNETQAIAFLRWLPMEMMQRKPHGPFEPMLIPVPSSRALGLAFPFAVVEGKAYLTGKQIFEAENQASVSGACGLKLQLDLDDLVARSTNSSETVPTTLNTEPPLFFTICTQGPIHELWAHWTVVKYGVRLFGSKLLDSCNALLLEQVVGFLVRLNNIGLWGLGPFMTSVVKRLGIVAAKALIGNQ
jgi:hypothetical protein